MTVKNTDKKSFNPCKNVSVCIFDTYPHKSLPRKEVIKIKIFFIKLIIVVMTSLLLQTKMLENNKNNS